MVFYSWWLRLVPNEISIENVSISGELWTKLHPKLTCPGQLLPDFIVHISYFLQAAHYPGIPWKMISLLSINITKTSQISSLKYIYESKSQVMKCSANPDRDHRQIHLYLLWYSLWVEKHHLFSRHPDEEGLRQAKSIVIGISGETV